MKTLFSRNAVTWWPENPLRVIITFLKKHCFPVITWNIKNSLKQIISITCMLKKKFFAAATFEGL